MSGYLVDASVWAAYLRGEQAAIKAKLEKFLDENRASISGVILAELLSGIAGEKDREFIKECFLGLPWLETTRETFMAAGKMGAALRLKGIASPLPDLLTLAQARAHGLTVLTLDGRLRKLAGLAGVPAAGMRES